MFNATEMKLLAENRSIQSSLLEFMFPKSPPRKGKVEEMKQQRDFRKPFGKEVMHMPVIVSCYELTMKPDKHARWTDMDQLQTNWDASVDDQEKALEEHVSKYGWDF